jgi:hypothetical protein
LAHPAFRPSRGPFFFSQPADFPSPLHWASASRPAQPTITAQPVTGRLLPPASKPSTVPPPACLTLPPQSPRCLHRKRKRPHLIPLRFPPLIGAIPPLFNPGNRRLQPHHSSSFKPAIEGTRPSPASPPQYKSRPALGEASHTPNAPSLSPHRTLAVALPSRSFRRW